LTFNALHGVISQKTELFTNDSSNYLEQITPSEADSPQLVKNFPAFYGQEYLLLRSQKPVTEAYPEPNESCPHAHILFLEHLPEYYSIIYASLQSVLITWDFPNHFYTT
jgi:hypothetical protein